MQTELECGQGPSVSLRSSLSVDWAQGYVTVKVLQLWPPVRRNGGRLPGHKAGCTYAWGTVRDKPEAGSRG
jgi:hypothetical protein